jgi:hypothetical protein
MEIRTLRTSLIRSCSVSRRFMTDFDSSLSVCGGRLRGMSLKRPQHAPTSLAVRLEKKHFHPLKNDRIPSISFVLCLEFPISPLTVFSHIDPFRNHNNPS